MCNLLFFKWGDWIDLGECNDHAGGDQSWALTVSFYKHPPSFTLNFILPFRAPCLPNSHGVIMKHSLLFFHPFSSFFLQEPQTTVIHNPVDGTKVHPLPPSISLFLHFSSSSSLSFCVGSWLKKKKNLSLAGFVFWLSFSVCIYLYMYAW